MKKLLACCFLVIYTSFSFACSTFLLSKDGKVVFGRNYDWVTGNGMVVINARGVSKTSFVKDGEKATRWTAKCGSITFNQFGKEFPHGGMNEKGLVVELMWLNGTVYPAADDRGALNELQWIQYQLDNFTTVQEVVASNKSIRISQKDAVPLHYLVADAMGNAATIEFINGAMVVHQDKELPFPVLTNTPYAEALQQVTAQKEKSSFGDNSVDRFATACKMVQEFKATGNKESAVDYAFTILEKVSQGEFTKWKIVYDLTSREIHFITAGKKKSVALKEFDFACHATPLFLNISSPQQGMVKPYFTSLKFDDNKRILQQSANESKTYVEVSTESVNAGAAYFRQVKCAE